MHCHLYVLRSALIVEFVRIGLKMFVAMDSQFFAKKVVEDYHGQMCICLMRSLCIYYQIYMVSFLHHHVHNVVFGKVNGLSHLLNAQHIPLKVATSL